MSVVPYDFEESYDGLVLESRPGVNHLLAKFKEPVHQFVYYFTLTSKD